MKPLKDLLTKIDGAEVTGNRSVVVTHLCLDSRQVSPGAMYAALRGTQADGHKFIDDAVAAGAGVILCEELPKLTNTKVTWVKVHDSAAALGLIASAFFGNPSEQLKVVGVTGTNGKTTIATLLYEAFTAMGYRSGLISTIRYITGSRVAESSHTTPDTIRIHQMLSDMLKEGCEYCFMEVSSHAAVQKRIAGITFTGGIFTNLTHDHLDFHGTFESYLRAKQSFFDHLPKEAFALTTKDDRNGLVLVQHTKARVYTYSTARVADYHCRVIENTMDGLNLELNGKNLWLRLTGAFNARNITAIYGTAMLLGVDEDQLLSVLSCLEPVAGRFQHFRSAAGITGIVDYAHTPDALANVLETIREVNRDEGKIITVVGAGGNRDPFKRPLMGKIAASLSDKLILTSDNPRNEDPQAILYQMKEGVNNEDLFKVAVVPDRMEAIRLSVMMAVSNDIILVAGKGHEKYQEIEGVKHPFDDMEVLASLLTNQ
jgi:UDP-N-acetylmuramoyl-L-alanyl-D-glutamate--2,6-diaminopimelate ligase